MTIDTADNFAPQAATTHHVELPSYCRSCGRPLVMLFCGDLLSSPIVDGHASSAADDQSRLHHCPGCGIEIGEAFDPTKAGVSK